MPKMCVSPPKSYHYKLGIPIKVGIMADWELLLIEKAKERGQPTISDLLALYGSCKYFFPPLCSLILIINFFILPKLHHHF